MPPNISYPTTPSLTPDFWLSLATIAIGVCGCVFFLAEWFRHRHKFLLFWSLGFLSLYWFQVPAVLANAGFRFTLTDFNLFYTLAFPLTFIGLILIYQGIRSVGLLLPGRIRDRHIFLWLAAALLLFLVYFLAFQNSYNSYVMEFLVVFLFFVPIHLLIISALLGWQRAWRNISNEGIRIGIRLMTASMALGLLQDFLALYKILLYPPQFWFMAVASSRLLFVLQSLGMLLLFLGFLFAHKGFKKMSPEAIIKVAEAGK